MYSGSPRELQSKSNSVKAMATDALTLCLARTSTDIVFTMKVICMMFLLVDTQKF